MQLPTPIQIGLPVSLFLIMLGLGMRLTLADFARVATRPRAALVGLGVQLVGVPLLAAAIVIAFAPPAELAIGLMVLAFCPSGTTSNLFTYLARGDVALSVSLTGAASLLTPFTVPLLTELALGWVGAGAREVDFPVAQTMARLAAVVLLPLVVGMGLATWRPRTIARVRPWVSRVSVAGFALVIAGIVVSLGERLPALLAASGVLCVTLMAAALACGHAVSRAAGLEPAQRRAIAIEASMQHGGMALLVTQGALASPAMSVVPVLYGLLMLVPVTALVVLSRARAPAVAAAA